METLPVELVEPILQNLPKCDLRSVRLVSKGLSAIASPYLFETIVLFPFEEILDWALYIATRPVGKCVRTLCYNPVMYDPNDGEYENFEISKYRFMNGLNVWNTRLDASSIPPEAALILKGAHKRYCQLVKSQTFVLAAENEFDYFRRIFIALRDVRNFELLGLDTAPPRMKSLSSETRHHEGLEALLDLKCPDEAHRLGRETLVYPSAFRFWSTQGNPDECGCNHGHLTRRILASAKLARSSLKKLDVRRFLMDTLPGYNGTATFPFLEQLSLQVETNSDSNAQRRLGDFLRSTPNLVCLDLDYKTDVWCDGALISEAFPNDLFWPRLVKLRLKGFETTPTAIISLLCRHKATLRDIELIDMGLCSTYDQRMGGTESWIPIFKKIHHSLKPDRVRLGGQFTNHSINPAEAWEIQETSCCKGQLHTDCLKGSVEWYMVNGGDLRPLPGRRSLQEEILLRHEGESKFEGDASWFFPHSDEDFLSKCVGYPALDAALLKAGVSVNET